VKKRHKALLVILFFIVGVPFILWLSWLLTTPRPVSVFIMDKSSYSKERINNRALNWVLKHYRFVKPNGKDYDSGLDYYGFFPGEKGNFTIRDLAKLSTVEMQQLAMQYNVAYYVDSYGVYSDEWPIGNMDTLAVSKIYGGLDWEDLLFLEYMLDLDRMVIAEFIFLAPPTQEAQRKKAEEILGVKWQGWTGRFFHTLDPDAPGHIIPSWILTLYQQQYGQSWPYKNAGIILVNHDETLVVLEKANQLRNPLLMIHTDTENQRKYGMSDNIHFSGWFDITFPSSTSSSVLSWYELDLTEQGKELLKKHNIPARFPAVIQNNKAGQVFYLAGDFGYSPIKKRFVRFKGARFAELFLADLNDPTDKSGFFLAYYLPMMKKILRDYQETIVIEP
jgi:hypothetical protein